MSVCGQTEEESGSEEPAGVGAGAAAVRDMYEQKAVSKVVRVLTVLAYLLSVSLAAILLSVYYVCVWQSPKLPLALTNETGEEASKRIGDPPPPGYNANASISHPKPSAYYPYPWHESRGGDSTVSEAMTSPSSNLSLPSEPPDPPEPSSPWDANSTDSAVDTAVDLNYTTPLPLPYALNATSTDQR